MNVLERMLNQSVKKRNSIDTINLSRKGFTTVNELEMFYRHGWQYQPNLVVLQYTLNDPLPSKLDFQNEDENWAFPVYDIIPFHGLNDYLTKNSYFYTFVNHRAGILQRKIFHKAGYEKLYKEDFQGWLDCKEALKLMAEGTREKGIEMLLVVFPSLEAGRQTRESYRYTDIHEKIAHIAQKYKIPIIDMLDIYIEDGRDFESWRAMALDGHPNEDAHRMAAKAIKEYILNNHLVKRRDHP